MKPTDLLAELALTYSEAEAAGLVKMLLSTMALRRRNQQKSLKRIQLSGHEDYTDADPIPCLLRHLDTSKGDCFSPPPHWSSNGRVNSLESISTESSETSDCKLHADNDVNQYTLENAFYALANENRATGGSRCLAGYSEVFICCVKQFFLDSYLSSGTLWQAMRTAFGNNEWISFAEFAEAYKVLQDVSTNAVSNIKRKDCFMQNFLSKTYAVQFKLAETANQGPLTAGEVDEVVRTTRVSIESLQKLRSCFDI